MPRFQVGEVVQLKSGGPEMTVKMVEQRTGRLICDWWDESLSKFKTKDFEPAQLKHVDEDEGGSLEPSL